jgi:hypothetical protein
MKKIKPEQILIGLAVIIGGFWVLSALAPKVPGPVTTGASPIAGGSGVGQSGALGTAIGNLVNALSSSTSTSSNQVTAPGAGTPSGADFSL